MMGKPLIILLNLLLFTLLTVAQTRPANPPNLPDTNKFSTKILAETLDIDTTSKRVHSPRKATFRSAIIPGWGQAYNRQYWKIPLVYALIGVPAGTYFYNNSWYKRSKYAYEIRLAKDTASFPLIYPKLEVLSTESLRFYRNEFRRNRDYSILYTLVAWGLNVVDATVSGHLKEFDVSDDLSLRINPMIQPGSNTKGVSMILAFKSPSHKMLQVK
jgi:hypothetical protein